MSIHSCTQADISEGKPKKKRRPLFGMKLRDAVLTAPEWVIGMNELADWTKKALDDISAYCWYACLYPSRGRKKNLMDVKKMAADWKALIVGLATSHDRIERDKWEHDIDDVLTPILSAPVKQIREFFSLLVKSMKEDKTVPFYVWRSLEIWEEKIVKNAEDDDVKKLKLKLAKEVADLVEEDVKRDIGEAVVGALMWRDPGTLRRIKKTITEAKATDTPAKVTTKTRTVGRQSCLFLVVEHNGEEQTVML